MSSSRTGRLLPQPPKSKLPYKTPLTNLRPHYLKPPNYYLGLMVFKYMCVSVWVCLCKSVLPVLTFLRGIGMNICLFTHLCLYACLCVSKCLHCVCLSVRAHARDGEGFLENGVAGEFGLNRHGYKPCGSGKGEFIIQAAPKTCVLEVNKVYVYLCVCLYVYMYDLVICAVVLPGALVFLQSHY